MFYLAAFVSSMLCALLYPFGSIYLAACLLLLLMSFSMLLLSCHQLQLTVLLVVIALGALRGYSSHYPVLALPAAAQHGYQKISATVLSIDKVSQNNKKFDVKTKYGRLRLRWYFAPRYLLVGDVWRLNVKLKQPQTNTGGFNKLYYFNANGITADGSVKFGDLQQRSPHNSLNYCRQHLAQVINKYVTNSHLAAVLIALTTGTRAWLDRADWQVFKDTGTSHLIAISGLHIGLVYVAVLILLERLLNFFPNLFLFIPRQRLASLVALLGAFGYSLLAGWSWSTQRASWMLLLSVLMANTYRNCSRWHGLLFAVFAIAILHPWALTQVGLYMSALAVASILWIMPHIKNKKFWLQALYMQTAVFFILMPIMITVFNNLTLLSWPANAIAIPWVSYLVLPVALLAVCITPVSLFMAKYCWKLAALLLQPIWLLLQYLASYSSCIFHPAVYSLWGFVSILIFSFGWLIFIPLSMRLVQMLFVLPLLVSSLPRVAVGGMRLFVMVGKGQLTLFAQTPGRTFVYARHLLARYSGYKYSLLPLLRSLHIDKIGQVVSYDFKAKRQLVAYNLRIENIQRNAFGFSGLKTIKLSPAVVLQTSKNYRNLDIMLRSQSWHQPNISRLDLKIERIVGHKSWKLSIYNATGVHNYLLKPGSSTRIDCRAAGGYKVYI